MRIYETIFVTSLAEEAIGPVVDKVKGLIEGHQGSILTIENMGTRPLEYAIKKQDKGSYILARYRGTRTVTTEVEKYLKLTDGILRCQTVRVEEPKAPPPDVKAAEGRETGHE